MKRVGKVDGRRTGLEDYLHAVGKPKENTIQSNIHSSMIKAIIKVLKLIPFTRPKVELRSANASLNLKVNFLIVMKMLVSFFESSSI